MSAPHSLAFRRRAVHHASRGEAPIPVVAQNLGVPEAILRDWIAELDAERDEPSRTDGGGGVEVLTPEPQAPSHSPPGPHYPSDVHGSPGPDLTDSSPAPSPQLEPRATERPQQPRRSEPAAAGGAGWLVVLAVLVVGMFMSVLDVTIVNIAIPAMQNDFGASTEDIQWVSTSYSLAEGVVVPLSAWLGIRYGLARVYHLSMIFFVVGSVLCGLAWDLNSMIAFRIVQAIPGGIIPVVALSMVYKIVPREKIGAAMGLYGLGIVVAPAVGPTLGGYLVEYLDWRLIFWVNVPIGILGILGALVWLPRFARARAHPLDVPGFAAIASGLFALLLAVSKGEDWGWGSYPVLILLTFAALALALFVVIELEVDHPLLDVRVFRSWPFTNSLLIMAVIFVGLFGILFFIPQSLQQLQGLGAFNTGLLLLPQAFAMAVFVPIFGQVYDRIGARWPAAVGLALIALGHFLLREVTFETSHTTLALLLMLRAAGMGMAMMPIMTGGIASLPPDRVDGASAYNTVVQRSAAAIGLAALTALFTTTQAQSYADRAGLMSSAAAPRSLLGQYAMNQLLTSHVFDTAFGDMMLVLALISALAAVSALTLPHGRPAPDPGRVVEM